MTIAHRPPSTGLAPSRGDNPFATCWTRPGALPYFTANGVSVESVVAAWHDAGRCGQIVGPHGVGKSTLLASIGEALVSDGWQARRLVFRPSEQPGPLCRQFYCDAPEPRVVWLIDGLEQLSSWRRWRLLRRRRATRAALLATTHRPAPGLPELASLTPSLPVVFRLFDALVLDRETLVTRAMAAEAFARTGGNVRETWFLLYDQHEALQQKTRASS